jgi:hypothetical protein
MKCPVTGKTDMIDDCHIKIEFGFGSDKDLTTYVFSPVHDEVGKRVIAMIQTMMPHGSVEAFSKDVMDDYFTNEWGQNDDE